MNMLAKKEDGQVRSERIATVRPVYLETLNMVERPHSGDETRYLPEPAMENQQVHPDREAEQSTDEGEEEHSLTVYRSDRLSRLHCQRRKRYGPIKLRSGSPNPAMAVDVQPVKLSRGPL